MTTLTNIAKPSSTNSFLLLQNGYYLLLQNGGKILIAPAVGSLTNVAKHTASLTNINK